MPKNPNKKLVMLVEDEASIIDVYKTAIEQDGRIKLDFLKYGRDVLEWILKVGNGEAPKPNLILLDLILPDANGIDLLKAIKNNNATKNIPVFILTNYSDESMEKEEINLGSESHIIKAKISAVELAKMVKDRLV